jgi:DNA modification methylase
MATRTSDFGVSGRVSHDSSTFYNTRLYREWSNGQGSLGKALPDQSLPPNATNQFFCHDSRHMSQLPDCSVHLMVTSPPYNVAKKYDQDLSMTEYRELLRSVFRETYRVLVDGGRAAVNVANVGRKPYIPLHFFIIEEMLSIGFQMRGEIIWDKGASSGTSTAWGSWMSASNPTLRDTHEYILVFSKGSFSRSKSGKKSTIGRDQFLEWTKSVWTFPSESARRVGHPAPFPLDLPLRLIHLYTFEGDVVLDPFAGSGTTCLAALDSNRRFVAYDIDPAYADLAQGRISLFKQQQERARQQLYLAVEDFSQKA